MVGGVCVPVIGPGHCVITVGVKNSPFDPTDHSVVPISGRSTFDSMVTGTEMLFDANTRASRRIRHNEDDFLEVYEQLFTVQGATAPGKPPAVVPIYGSFFPNINSSDTGSSGGGPGRLDYDATWRQTHGAFCSDARRQLLPADRRLGAAARGEQAGVPATGRWGADERVHRHPGDQRDAAVRKLPKGSQGPHCHFLNPPLHSH